MIGPPDRKFWAILALIAKFGFVFACLLVIGTATYDAILDQKMGTTAAEYGLFWLMGVTFVVNRLLTMICKSKQKAAGFGNSQ